MKIFYSNETGGFYFDFIHKDIPSDSVEISQENYAELMNKQTNRHTIVADENGYPIATDEPVEQ